MNRIGHSLFAALFAVIAMILASGSFARADSPKIAQIKTASGQVGIL